MRRLLIVLPTALLLSGCASSLSGSAYERGQTRTVHEVEMGTVEHIRGVLIEGTKSGIGAAAGGVAGSAVGRNAGHSVTGKVVGSVAGAVIGGIGGAAVEEGVTRQKGYEITVRLDSGRLLAITQAADEEFRVGQRVRLIHGGRGATRVSH